MQDLYTDNYKMLLTGIKKDLKNKHIVLPDWRTQYYEDSRYPRLICSFRAIQSKFHPAFWVEMINFILNLHGKAKELLSHLNNSGKEQSWVTYIT